MNDSDTSPATSSVMVDATSPIPGDAQPAELLAQALGIAVAKAADILDRAGGIAGFTYGKRPLLTICRRMAWARMVGVEVTSGDDGNEGRGAEGRG